MFKQTRHSMLRLTIEFYLDCQKKYLTKIHSFKSFGHIVAAKWRCLLSRKRDTVVITFTLIRT